MFVAIFERLTTGSKFSAQTYIALALIFIGSAIYASTEKQSNLEGIGYVMLNVVLCIVLPVLEKRFVQVRLDYCLNAEILCFNQCFFFSLFFFFFSFFCFQDIKTEQTAAGLVTYRNSISLPVLMFFAMFR